LDQQAASQHRLVVVVVVAVPVSPCRSSLLLHTSVLAAAAWVHRCLLVSPPCMHSERGHSDIGPLAGAYLLRLPRVGSAAALARG